MTPKTLEAHHLTKKFGSFTALKSFSLSGNGGECIALLGPNGAGKTTCLRCLIGFLVPDEGEIFYFGKNFFQERDFIKGTFGVVNQEDTIDYDFNALENLSVYSRYFGIPFTREQGLDLLEKFDLKDRADKNPSIFSGGMKRRLQMARALVNNPRILFLDEPSTGLDPQARKHLWEIIHKLKKEGLLILLTTHYMDEAQNLADRVILIDKGEKVTEGEFDLLKKEHFKPHFITLKGDKNSFDLLKELDWPFQESLGNIHFNCDSEQLVKFQEKWGTRPFEMRPPNLEDLFIKLTGKELRD